MSAAPPRLSLVLACYNEAEHLQASFAEIKETLEQASWPYEVIFVDDASRDRTREILDAIVARTPGWMLVLHEANRGRGATVTDGFRVARGEVTGYLDVDLEVHPRYVPSLVHAIENGADIATVPPRVRLPGPVARPLLHEPWLLVARQAAARTSFRDTETGYKFFRREEALPVLDEIEDGGWFWDTEFMARAARRGLSDRSRSPAPTSDGGQDVDGAGSATRRGTSASCALPAELEAERP